MSPSPPTSEHFFEKASKAAGFYGFLPAHLVFASYKDIKRDKISPRKPLSDPRLRQIAALLRFCFERSLHKSDTPLLVFHSNIDKNTRRAISASKKPDQAYFALTVINVPNPYAEALVLSCASRIFQSMRSKRYRVRINSMGTTDDSKKYFSKLNKTLRKIRGGMRPDCRDLFDQGRVMEAHRKIHDDPGSGIAEHITQTLRLLSDTARSHFEQTIEYLEAHQLPYDLAPDLIEHPHFGVHTTFEIVSEDSVLRARGGRYDPLSYYLYRRKVPVISLTLTLPETVTDSAPSGVSLKDPKAFFLHAGEKAHLHSLFVLSKLCNANIPVAHRLHRTRVFDQMNDRDRAYPYTIIFGQEEVESDTLRIRREDTRMSSVVRIDDSLRSIKDFMRA